jgi:hypothetical protein
MTLVELKLPVDRKTKSERENWEMKTTESLESTIRNRHLACCSRLPNLPFHASGPDELRTKFLLLMTTEKDFYIYKRFDDSVIAAPAALRLLEKSKRCCRRCSAAAQQCDGRLAVARGGKRLTTLLSLAHAIVLA